ncbi:MAG: glycosyltransferase [Clostridiales bacterium]|nr:glycosyltransferase [Clostridiales bacterium]
MKYLFINTVAGYGSTGRIAADKCRELNGQGHTCVLAYGRMITGCDDIQTVKIGSDFAVNCHALESRVLDNSGFGSRRATIAFLKWVREFDPDVIWLHNVHGYYIHIGELFGYLRTCGKKIIWTLHDCWAFTGHCTYFDYVRCEKWKTGCHDCPQKRTYPESLLLDGSRRNFERKKALFTGIPDLTLTVPSHWLESRVKQSFLKDYPVEVIYNQVDKSVFKPTPGDFRLKNGLEGKFVILGVASVWEERKGLKDFIALSKLLDDRFRIVLIGLNQQQLAALPGEILGLPRTNNVHQLVQAYSEADVFVCPSTEETFGMTVLEACCCGCKTVVYQDTACQEVANLYGGIAVPRGAEHLKDAILKLTGEDTK